MAVPGGHCCRLSRLDSAVSADMGTEAAALTLWLAAAAAAAAGAGAVSTLPVGAFLVRSAGWGFTEGEVPDDEILDVTADQTKCKLTNHYLGTTFFFTGDVRLNTPAGRRFKRDSRHHSSTFYVRLCLPGWCQHSCLSAQQCLSWYYEASSSTCTQLSIRGNTGSSRPATASPVHYREALGKSWDVNTVNTGF